MLTCSNSDEAPHPEQRKPLSSSSSIRPRHLRHTWSVRRQRGVHAAASAVQVACGRPTKPVSVSAAASTIASRMSRVSGPTMTRDSPTGDDYEMPACEARLQELDARLAADAFGEISADRLALAVEAGNADAPVDDAFAESLAPEAHARADRRGPCADRRGLRRQSSTGAPNCAADACSSPFPRSRGLREGGKEHAGAAVLGQAHGSCHARHELGRRLISGEEGSRLGSYLTRTEWSRPAGGACEGRHARSAGGASWARVAAILASTSAEIWRARSIAASVRAPASRSVSSRSAASPASSSRSAFRIAAVGRPSTKASWELCAVGRAVIGDLGGRQLFTRHQRAPPRPARAKVLEPHGLGPIFELGDVERGALSLSEEGHALCQHAVDGRRGLLRRRGGRRLRALDRDQ